MKRILLIIFIVILFANCTSFVQTEEVNRQNQIYYGWEREIARQVRYSYEVADRTGQARPVEIYKSSNPIIGDCGTYATLMAITYDADFMFFKQLNLPNGRYRLVGEWKEEFWHYTTYEWFGNQKEITEGSCITEHINWDWNGDGIIDEYFIVISHHILGLYVIELVESMNIRRFANGSPATGLPHVWNIIDNVQLDATAVDHGWIR